MSNLLEMLSDAYYNKGLKLISDEHYDALERLYEESNSVGSTPSDGEPHLHRMYSLQKVFDEDPIPSTCVDKELIRTPKLDGAAISLVYKEGFLVKGLTRGDGIVGKNISDKVLCMDSIPKQISLKGFIQISGEVVANKDFDNARNVASGSLNLKDLNEFLKRDLTFIAYSIQGSDFKTYKNDLDYLHTEGFNTALHTSTDNFLTDGNVYRINDNETYYNLGYTNKHPRGAYAQKIKSDVAIVETLLKDVIWQTGASGKVTPVAIFDEVVIDDAKISRATLHNVGFIENLNLNIGDTLLVTRSGGIIPKILDTKEHIEYILNNG